MSDHNDLSTEPKRGLFFYRAYDPAYRQWQTIDSGARTEAAAYADLRRYVGRVNRKRPKGFKIPALNHPAKMGFEPWASEPVS